jgi:tripartite-type tricarboxylate transporter receptor subunit TctC
MTNLKLGILLWSGLAMFAATAAQAQTYPSQNITIVVGSQPGGTTDLLARLLAQNLTTAWGKTVIVENKVGANNQVAGDFVRRAAPDGHTLWVSPDSFVTNAVLNTKLSADGYAPISGLVRAYHTLIANPALSADTVGELIALAKAKPDSLNYSTSGFGSAGHLSMEYLQSRAGIKFTGVHYKGAAPAFTDVLAGHVQLMFHDLGSVSAAGATGKVKLLGVGAPSRVAKFPQLPAIAETVPGFEAGAWWGLFAPAGTPDPVIKKINGEVQKILASPTVQTQLIAPHSMQVFTGSPAALRDFVNKERVKWQTLVRDANIKIQ